MSPPQPHRSSLVARRLSPVACSLLLLSCNTKRPAPPPDAAPPVAGAPTTDPADVKGTPEHIRRFRDAPVVLDGELVAILRFGELPPGLAPKMVTLADGRQARRYRMSDWLVALGVDLAAVQAVHWHGGRGRVAVVPGDALRRWPDELIFSFTGGTAGKPRVHWISASFRPSDQIDLVSAVAIYGKRKAPTWDADRGVLLLDGKPVTLPYVDLAHRGGVRVYVGGRIAGTLKRKRLREADRTPEGQYQLLPSVQRIAPKFHAATLVGEDGAVLTTLDAAQLARATFEAPADASGYIRLLLPPTAVLEVEAFHLALAP